MPKKVKDYPEQINILAREGMKIQLKAIGYYRGEGGHEGPVVRDFLERGVRKFMQSLTPTERKKFNSILATVTESDAIAKATRAHRD